MNETISITDFSGVVNEETNKLDWLLTIKNTGSTVPESASVSYKIYDNVDDALTPDGFTEAVIEGNLNNPPIDEECRCRVFSTEDFTEFAKVVVNVTCVSDGVAQNIQGLCVLDDEITPYSERYNFENGFVATDITALLSND